MTAITKNNWTLVNTVNRQPVHVGDVALDFRGERHVINGGTPPHKPSSSGFIHTSNGAEFYAGVCSLAWVQQGETA